MMKFNAILITLLFSIIVSSSHASGPWTATDCAYKTIRISEYQIASIDNLKLLSVTAKIIDKQPKNKTDNTDYLSAHGMIEGAGWDKYYEGNCADFKSGFPIKLWTIYDPDKHPAYNSLQQGSEFSGNIHLFKRDPSNEYFFTISENEEIIKFIFNTHGFKKLKTKSDFIPKTQN